MSYVASRDGRRNRSAAHRPPVVPARIDDLHGNSLGTLEVPHHMACGHASRRQYDLEDPAQLRTAYQQVLCEAAGCGEVEDLINPAVLRRVWRDLHLPEKVREAWETQHPSLRRPAKRTSAGPSRRPAAAGFNRRGRARTATTPTRAAA